ncbi:hypothetical protein DBT_1237 [Dissulfuribacter thermophilus]|uniref:Uncharacterized protein n=1 Tax=Dissulfuribacter thermophilus TaxID=1156395 RepID=A0A1B9F6G0_9BACT|nr:hypothetical protein DBT_1237 [Dissulfuribacter thermophilus]
MTEFARQILHRRGVYDRLYTFMALDTGTVSTANSVGYKNYEYCITYLPQYFFAFHMNYFYPEIKHLANSLLKFFLGMKG